MSQHCWRAEFFCLNRIEAFWISLSTVFFKKHMLNVFSFRVRYHVSTSPVLKKVKGLWFLLASWRHSPASELCHRRTSFYVCPVAWKNGRCRPWLTGPVTSTPICWKSLSKKRGITCKTYRWFNPANLKDLKIHFWTGSMWIVTNLLRYVLFLKLWKVGGKPIVESSNRKVNSFHPKFVTQIYQAVAANWISVARWLKWT